MAQFTGEQVQLKKSNVVRTMTVENVGSQGKVPGARGTVRFSGKILIVVFDGSKWNQV